MNDRFIRLSISLARLQKVIQRIKASGMSRIELKAGHTLVLCRLKRLRRVGIDSLKIPRQLVEHLIKCR